MKVEFKKRHEAVLEIIIKEYTETAEPVGSRYVARRLDLSSATIRNVMADLEEMGFITHPHTSAGRVPTDKGYRYFIDRLMHVRKVADDTVRIISHEYQEVVRSMEDALERTSHLISSLTNYVGITLYPQYQKVYMNGASHILEQPEFRDLKKLYSILRFLEGRRAILSLLSEELLTDTLSIHIGTENKLSDLRDCSIVTRGYKIRGKVSGRVGVIGPKRMVYERVIPMVETLADTLSTILDRIE